MPVGWVYQTGEVLSALLEGAILAARSRPGGAWRCLDAMHEVGVLLGEGWGYSGYVGTSCSTDNPRLVDPHPRAVWSSQDRIACSICLYEQIGDGESSFEVAALYKRRDRSAQVGLRPQ